MGRATTYTEQRADEICRRLSEGETLRQICRDKGMPHWATVYHWMEANKEFSLRIARAREQGFDAIAEQALAIADTPLMGEEIEKEGSKLKIKRSDMLGHRRLQVETRLKLLSKWSPAKYGDRASVELTGAGGGPVQISDAEREAKIAGLVAKAQARQLQEQVRDDGEA